MPHCPVTVVQRYRDGICSLLFHLFFIICHPYIPLHLEEEMIFYTCIRKEPKTVKIIGYYNNLLPLYNTLYGPLHISITTVVQLLSIFPRDDYASTLLNSSRQLFNSSHTLLLHYSFTTVSTRRHKPTMEMPLQRLNLLLSV